MVSLCIVKPNPKGMGLPRMGGEVISAWLHNAGCLLQTFAALLMDATQNMLRTEVLPV